MSNVIGHPQPDRDERATQAQAIRTAAHSAPQRGQARTSTNGEELTYGESFAGCFHKALPHGPTGFVDPAAYREYTDALLQQDHARFEGLPYRMPATFPIPTQNAARIFWWLHDTQGPEAAAAVAEVQPDPAGQSEARQARGRQVDQAIAVDVAARDDAELLRHGRDRVDANPSGAEVPQQPERVVAGQDHVVVAVLIDVDDRLVEHV